MLAHQPADPATEGEAGDAGRRDQTASHRQPERLCFVIELSPGHATLHDDALGIRVDPDPFHLGQVDDHSAVRGREPRQAVSTTPNGKLEILTVGELHGSDDVGDTGAADDERRTPIDHPIPDGARLVVARVGGRDDLTSGALAKFLDRRVAEDRSHRRVPPVPRSDHRG